MLKKKNNYKASGWGFILLSIFCVVIFLIDYKTKFIFDLTSISELGTILGGTSGLFASLAGLFFVLENLEMQRKTISHQQKAIKQQQISIELQREELKNQILEMKESNEYFKQQTETLKIQTTESAFFQLLDNHRNLVNSLSFGEENGYAGLTKYYKNLKKNAEGYFQAAHTGNVGKVENGSMYPLRILSQQIENVEQLYNNIYHLIKLIRVKLFDDLFYHDTFYNSLSKAEKYILGLYVVNEKLNEISVFQNEAFNYLEYFEGSGNAYYNKVTVPFFPNIRVSFNKPWNKFTFYEYRLKNLNTDIGEIEIKVINNEFNLPIILKSTIIEYNWRKKDYYDPDEWGIEIGEQCNINIFSKINDHVFLRYVENYDPSKISDTFLFVFKIIFVIIYNKHEFKYVKHLTCESYNSTNRGADLQIKDNRI